jgi:hypothetical protein
LSDGVLKSNYTVPRTVTQSSLRRGNQQLNLASHR